MEVEEIAAEVTETVLEVTETVLEVKGDRVSRGMFLRKGH